MRRALLDTDIFSEVAKGKNEFVRRRALTYVSTVGPLAISTVTVVEVVKGFRKVGRDLERVGQPIGRADPMIAGIALARGLVLVTGNRDHYERIIRAGHPIEIED